MNREEASLVSDIEKFDCWFNNKNISDNEVIVGIGKFYLKYKKIKCDKHYKAVMPRLCHFSYLMYLYKIKTALDEKKYQLACNEIISLIHYEPFKQARIKANLLYLLNDKFKFEVI